MVRAAVTQVWDQRVRRILRWQVWRESSCALHTLSVVVLVARSAFAEREVLERRIPAGEYPDMSRKFILSC